MKTVGIMTFHAAHNYGSVVQAYALSKWLSMRGYAPEIINLRTDVQKKAYRVFTVKGHGIKRAVHFVYAVVTYSALKKRSERFEKFIHQMLPVSQKEFSNGAELVGQTDYDIYLAGSDQVWNPACLDFESAYYLDFVSNGAKRISYAPSLGKSRFEEHHMEQIRRLISNIDVISCREEAGANILRQFTEKPVEVVCDPTVLLGRRAWEDFAVATEVKKPYILTYFLENNHGSKSVLERLQSKTGYDVVVLNEDIHDFFKPYHKIYDASPQQFVGLFQNASFVLTNSFHGTAFSTIFNRPFYTVVGKDTEENNNDSRKIDYLKKLGLENRIIFDDRIPESKELFAIDFSEANQRMLEMQEGSANYIMHALED